MKADKKKILKLLKTAKGQINGIIQMVEDDRYCIDIVNQIMASKAVLKRATKDILKGHLSSCVADSFSKNGKDKSIKIEEIVKVFDRM